MWVTKRESNRFCSVGRNDLKLYSNGRLLLLWFAATSRFDETKPATHSQDRQTTAVPSPLPLLTLNFSCDRVREIRSTAPVRRRPFYITVSISRQVIGTHSRLTKQDTGYAQRRCFARTLSSIAPSRIPVGESAADESQRPPLARRPLCANGQSLAS